MSNKIQSVTKDQKLLKSIEALRDHLKEQRLNTTRNTRELQNLNAALEISQEDKIVEMEKKIIKLKEELKWVRDEDPAIDFNRGNILKKLDVL
jgi:hypothetical protein